MPPTKPDPYVILGALLDTAIIALLATWGSLAVLVKIGAPPTWDNLLTAFIMAGVPAALLYAKQLRGIRGS